MDLPEDFWSQLHYLSDSERSELAASMDQEPSVAIRLNARKWPNAALPRVPWNAEGHYLDDRPSFTADPLFHAGVYYVQEPSSMVIGTIVSQWLADVDHEVRVLDLCGAPGGKSTDIANQLRDGDLLLSNEVISSRVQVLKENTVKWGRTDHHVCSNDPKDFQRLPGLFDMVVVDAPCSGEGLFRKDAGALDQWSPEAVDFCQQRQLRIVQDVWNAIAEGGLLIYSTCTLNQKENEEVLKYLITNYDVSPFDFVPSPDWGFKEFGVGDFSLFKVFPHLTRGEGFSFFVLRKNEPTASVMNRRRKGKKNEKKSSYDGREIGLEGDLYLEGDRVLSYNDHRVLEMLDEHLRLVKRGTLVGTLKKNRLVPSHEWAMAPAMNKEKWPIFNLDYSQAISYLRKDTLTLPQSEKGFALVVYRGQPLGWVNHLGSRVNNGYPSEYRILTQTVTLTDPKLL